MIIADKYKKNKFRKLVPTSTAETDKLNQIATTDHDKQPTRPQIVISQDIKRSASKVAVERVSQRYKEKHFVFERKLKTISAINQREDEPTKHSNSSVGQYRTEREKAQAKKPSKLQSLLGLIEQFKAKTEQISKAQRLDQLRIADIQEEEAKFDELAEKTRIASARLFWIYLQRVLKATRRQILQQIVQFQGCPSLSAGELEAQAERKAVIQVEEGQPRAQRGSCRRNLINVSKFFGST